MTTNIRSIETLRGGVRKRKEKANVMGILVHCPNPNRSGKLKREAQKVDQRGGKKGSQGGYWETARAIRLGVNQGPVAPRLGSSGREACPQASRRRWFSREKKIKGARERRNRKKHRFCCN